MFEAAGARRSDENLRIAFNFDQASPELALTLQEFREIEAFVRRVARSVTVRQWDSNTLFPLNNDVRSFVNVADPRTGGGLRAQDSRVRRWADRNGKPEWQPFPGFPRSGDPRLDGAVSMAEDLVDEMMVEVTRLGATYDAFSQRMSDLRPDDGAADAGELLSYGLIAAARDFWPNAFGENLCMSIEVVNGRTGVERTELAERLADVISTAFDRPPRFQRTKVSLE
jgi:hypothetical protein